MSTKILCEQTSQYIPLFRPFVPLLLCQSSFLFPTLFLCPSCCLMSSTLVGYVSTINELLKCHSPLCNIPFLSFFELNLKMKIFSPKLSTFTFFTYLYTCCIAALSPSQETPRVLRIFLMR